MDTASDPRAPAMHKVRPDLVYILVFISLNIVTLFIDYLVFISYDY